MKKRLPTPKQKDVLDFIQSWIAREGVSPRIADIQEGLGYHSTASVYDHLETLEARGLIVSTKNREGRRLPRSILIPKSTCPTCGQRLA